MSNYRVFSRKYRPQRFEEIIGQEHITRTLQNAIQWNRLAQAYLFVGPRGVGKTSTARILAKAMNCQANSEKVAGNPCGICEACIETTEGRSLDVIEIDGASNNSVESVRELRENATYAPSRGIYKIYLIDEVHMLSSAAFNALLKTLEEPPSHVKFLFATTEAHKVPATILSRCQRFDLRLITTELIANHLLYIANKEQISIELVAVNSIARTADGALRDAESMLDQVIAFCGTTITASDVYNVFGLTPRETVLDLMRALLEKNISSALSLVQIHTNSGKDPSRLLRELLGLLRDILVNKAHPQKHQTDESSLGEGISQEKLLLLLDHFSEAESRLRWAVDKGLQMDVSMIKAIHLLDEVNLNDIIDMLTSIRKGSSLPETTSIESSSQPPSPILGDQVSFSEDPIKHLSLIPSDLDSTIIQPQVSNIQSSIPCIKILSEVSEKQLLGKFTNKNSQDGGCSENLWHSVAKKLATEFPLKFGWLEDGIFIKISDKTIIVDFPHSLQQQGQVLCSQQAINKIEQELLLKFQEPLIFQASFNLKDALTDNLETVIANTSPLEDNNKNSSSNFTPLSLLKRGEDALLIEEREELQAFHDDPLIKKALEIFKAKILMNHYST